MNPSLAAALYDLPSVRSFLESVQKDLARSRSVITILPMGIEIEDIWIRLRTSLSHREFHCCEIVLPSISEPDIPNKVVSQALALDAYLAKKPYIISNLLGCPDLPEIIYLEGLDKLPWEAQKNWVAFIKEWARLTQDLSHLSQPLTSFCAFLQGESTLNIIPENNVHLSVSWWWGFPSVLECQLLCRVATEIPDYGPRQLWKEQVLPALSSGDTRLIEALWDCDHFCEKEMTNLLIEYAKIRGWVKEKIEIWVASDLRNRIDKCMRQNAASTVPPKNIRSLWSEGLICSTSEYGIELHSAALALLDEEQSLRHRLWRGQAKILLPYLDDLRLEICRRLTNYYGRDWPTRWDQPQQIEDGIAVRENPLATSWGYLSYLLQRQHALSPFYHLRPLVKMGRDLRNKMAHYQPVTFSDFEELVMEESQVLNGK